MVLLYLDVLGMKARWATGDIEIVKRAFAVLDEIVEKALSDSDPRIQESVSGGIQSDAAALVFENATDAVTIGRAIFREAFFRGSEEERFWLRGVIIPVESAELETTVDLTGGARNVKKRVFCDPLMNAINYEQSGFGGQRLLIDLTLVDSELAYKFLTPVRETGHVRSLFHLCELRDSQTVQGFKDVLWMAPDDIANLENERVEMGKRLRWSAGARDEFRHASLTMLVFEECHAIVAWIRGQ